MLGWAQRKKLAVLSILFIFVIIVGIFFLFKILEQAAPTPPQGRSLPVLWARFFETREGFVDVAALVENPNNFGVEKLNYSFKVYDKNNILIAIKEGETFAGPLEKFVIFEPSISISEREPSRVLIDIQDVIFSPDFAYSRPKIDVLGTEKLLDDVFPRIVVNIKNRGDKSLENTQSTVVVYGEDQNAIAVSRTIISFLGIDEEKSLVFTWLKSINGASSVEVFFR